MKRQFDFSSALIKFDQAIQCNPRNASALWGKADALQFLNKNDLALDACHQALQVDPNNDRAYYVQANVYTWGLGKYDLALNAINMALKTDPQYGAYYITRGVVYDNMGLYDLALMDKETSISLSGNDTKYNQAVGYNNCAVTCVKLNKLDTALKYCNKSIELNPDDDSHHAFDYDSPRAMRAFLLASRNQHEDAMKEFNMLMSKDVLLPVHDQPLCYTWIGRMFLEMKDIDHALEYFQKSSKSNYCGIVLYMKGDFNNAFIQLPSYIKSFPGDVGNFIQYGTKYGMWYNIQRMHVMHPRVDCCMIFLIT